VGEAEEFRHRSKNQILLHSEQGGGIQGNGLTEPIRLMSIRAQNEPEFIFERPVEFLPIGAPYVTVVDLDQTLGRYPVQVGAKCIRMSDYDRPILCKQFLQSAIVIVLVPAMVNGVVGITACSLIRPGMPVDFDTEFQPGFLNLIRIALKLTVCQVLEMIADPDCPGMFYGGHQGNRLLRYW